LFNCVIQGDFMNYLRTCYDFPDWTGNGYLLDCNSGCIVWTSSYHFYSGFWSLAGGQIISVGKCVAADW